MHTLVAAALALVALALAAFPAAAQPLAADTSCTVASCGIEMRRAFLIGFRLEQGGEPLPRYGPLGLGAPRIADAVRDSPAALAHAHDYERHLRTVSQLQTGAIALLLLGAVNPFGVISDEARAGLSVGALGLSVATVPLVLRARRSAEDAVDVYNESLP